jgi:hypothetical protein
VKCKKSASTFGVRPARKQLSSGSRPGPPESAKAKVEEVVPVDTTAPRFDDPNVQFTTVPGTRDREAALVVRTPNGTTLVVNDLVGNIRDEAGLGGWLLRWVGVAGKKAQIPKVVKMALIKERARCAISCCGGPTSSR